MWIVGYIGTEQASGIILNGLEKLEYRGYDSAGMAVFDGNKINITKAVGRLKALDEITHGGESMPGNAVSAIQDVGDTWCSKSCEFPIPIIMSRKPLRWYTMALSRIIWHWKDKINWKRICICFRHRYRSDCTSS